MGKHVLRQLLGIEQMLGETVRGHRCISGPHTHKLIASHHHEVSYWGQAKSIDEPLNRELAAPPVRLPLEVLSRGSESICTLGLVCDPLCHT